MAAHGGSMLFGGLRGEALYQARLGDSPITVISHFEKEYGRIRAVAKGPDGMIYFTTSNRDGRGVPKQGDDRIVRVSPRLFQ
jgi:glucose/arabinose dehydrogenase